MNEKFWAFFYFSSLSQLLVNFLLKTLVCGEKTSGEKMWMRIIFFYHHKFKRFFHCSQDEKINRRKREELAVNSLFRLNSLLMMMGWANFLHRQQLRVYWFFHPETCEGSFELVRRILMAESEWEKEKHDIQIFPILNVFRCWIRTYLNTPRIRKIVSLTSPKEKSIFPYRPWKFHPHPHSP